MRQEVLQGMDLPSPAGQVRADGPLQQIVLGRGGELAGSRQPEHPAADLAALAVAQARPTISSAESRWRSPRAA